MSQEIAQEVIVSMDFKSIKASCNKYMIKINNKIKPHLNNKINDDINQFKILLKLI